MLPMTILITQEVCGDAELSLKTSICRDINKSVEMLDSDSGLGLAEAYLCPSC